MSMKCTECENATETQCPTCKTGLCIDMPAYKNTCTADHNQKHHAPPPAQGSRFAEANIIVKGARAEAESRKHEAAVMYERAVNAEASLAALAKFLDAAYPDAAARARREGLI